jgi:c-di-GMP-binding flagellar brake protein YcgR
MAVSTLMRRQGQRDLLTQLSAKRRQVTVGLLTDGPHGTVRTRFLALARDGVLLDWPHAGLGNIPESSATVAVHFEHLGERLGFRVPALGRTTWHATGRGRVPAWKLALPVRIEPVQQRRHFRVSLVHRTPLVAQCISVDDPTRGFAIRLRNLSSGGLCATADRAHATQLRAGATFWTRFALPDEPAPVELVVRVAHTHENLADNTLVFGGMFCAGDDPRYHRVQMVRIERFLTRPSIPQPTATPSAPGKGN